MAHITTRSDIYKPVHELICKLKEATSAVDKEAIFKQLEKASEKAEMEFAIYDSSFNATVDMLRR